MSQSSHPSTQIRENSDYSFQERMQIIWRCVFNRCPNCNHGGISSPLRFPKSCPNCGFVLDRENGFLLTALPAAYFAYALFFLVPLLVLFLQGMLSFQWTMWLGIIGSLTVPAVIFNYCKMLGVALYYFFLPRELEFPEVQDDV